MHPQLGKHLIMTKPPLSFDDLPVLHEGAHSLIFRGERDGRPVMFKRLRAEYPTPNEVVRFRHEYELTRKLTMPGVVETRGLEPYRGSLVMLLEDFGGEAVSVHLKAGPLDLISFLKLAISVAETLGHVHHRHVIHKDICPANIVWNKASGVVKLIDFGISTELSRETATAVSPNVLEGTLAYMAPEQTGRMNRSVDDRSDLYGLGATFYHLLTGAPPFVADDDMELVHAHIAKTPTPVHEVRSEVPETLSRIVAKLMAKLVEDRYQSAYGVMSDLKACLEQIERGGAFVPFAVGQHDLSDQFHIPQKLYGRQAQVKRLLDAFDRAAQGDKEMLLVAGYSGIGKSSLVHEVQKPIVHRRGYFIEGKFDQFQRDVPYASLIQAFQRLARQLLTEPEATLVRWRDELNKALAPNGQVIIEVIPEIELIIGPQPPIPQLAPAEANNRFNRVFQTFVQAFGSPAHPLVVFLDDLQWADFPSLAMLELLMSGTSGEHHILLLGAYRDNEVSPTHPLMQSLSRIEDGGTVIDTLTLTPLAFDDANQLIADTVFSPAGSTRDLTTLCLEKTQGNPFFLNQFLRALHEAGSVTFDENAGTWCWDMAHIRRMGMTDNVVELMAGKIQRLGVATIEALKLAACIGALFELEALAIVAQKSPRDIAADLWPALKEGLILPLDQSYKFVEYLAGESETAELLPSYRFLHDRVQQAAYSLIAESDRKQTHRRIGQLLLEKIPSDEREEHIFSIVGHLNVALDLPASAHQREELAALNLYAGKKAKASSAYQPALNHLRIGLDLLPADGWESLPDLTRDLTTQAAEAAYLVGQYEDMERWVKVLLDHSPDPLDQVPAYLTIIRAHMANNRLREAIESGLHLLRQLGEKFPRIRTKAHVITALLRALVFMRGRDIAALRHLPPMSDPRDLAVMQVVNQIYSAAYISEPNQMVLNSIRLAVLSVQKGNTPISAFGYASYGLVLCGVIESIEDGHRFAALALDLQNDFQAHERKCRTWFMVHNFVWHWKQPLRDSLAPLVEAYRSGLDAGELEFAGYAAFIYSNYAFFSGQPLQEREEETGRYVQDIANIKQQTSLYYTRIVLQTVINLRHGGEDPTRLLGSAYDEVAMLPLHQNANDITALAFFYVHKLLLCTLFGDTRQGLTYLDPFSRYQDGVVAMFHGTVYRFYAALTCLAAAADSTGSARRKLLAQARKHQKKIDKWARHNPANQAHRSALIAAEFAKLAGEDSKAIGHYRQAIALARQNQFIQDEAVAHERYAAFWQGLGEEDAARFSLRQARHCYRMWGADAKIRQMEAHYPFLQHGERADDVEPTLSPLRTRTRGHTQVGGTTSGLPSSRLDVLSLTKASQALSGQIVLARLLEDLMRLALENAGAERGRLLLVLDGKWRLVAQGAGQRLEVGLAVPLDDLGETLPVSLISYVIRTREPVVLDNAGQEPRFLTDPYISDNSPKSVLGLPVLRQGQLIGVLYMENNLSTGVFTTDRLDMLSLLMSQAAISLENARLYQGLETQVAERTKELDASLRSLASLLDNSGQGFLSFDADLRIGERFSRACATMLGGSPAGGNAADVLFPGDPASADLLRLGVALALGSKTDATRRALALSLLPAEVRHGPRWLGIQYKPLDADHLLVVLTDVTEERRLAATTEREHLRLGLVVAAVTDSGAFFDAVDAFRSFLHTGLAAQTDDRQTDPAWRLQDLYREVHTFKGVLNQFSFCHTPEALHSLESRLEDLREDPHPLTHAAISAVVDPVALASMLEADLNELRAVLGAEFLAKGRQVSLSGEQMATLERLAVKLRNGEAIDADDPASRRVLEEIGHLRQIRLSEALAGYDRLIGQMAARMEKRVAPIIVEGDDEVWITPERYRPFLHALLHVFRNALVHGIETPARRLAAGKPEAGRIRCSVEKLGSSMRLSISDDGAGINFGAVREKARAQGLGHDLSEAQTFDVIFIDAISTNEEADQFSGRGVGLAAVRAEVEKLGGTVFAQPGAGAGTRIVFTLPLLVGAEAEGALVA